jgi:ABC-type polysaccharide/polyol phosphate transport system ATPase subunit
VGGIKAEGLSVTYRLYHERNQSLKERLLRGSKSRFEDLRALSDVSFEVGPGEVFGVIGENGSGKSTLLKVLSGVIEAESGTLEIGGRVAALLELGAGFHPDLTGRENIYLYGAILGLTRKEIDGHFEAIVEFSEIEDFIDVPVRNYSSGMYVRLGFSIAAHVVADVLLVDEVLAVGDAHFQAKCIETMREHCRSGAAIVLVTHDLAKVREFCTSAMWLHHGVNQAQGDVAAVTGAYSESVFGPAQVPAS